MRAPTLPRLATTSIFLATALATVACGSAKHFATGDDGDDSPGPDAGQGSGSGSGAPTDAPVDPTGCPAGPAGAACVLATYDRAIAGCAPEDVAALRTELDARAGEGPLWFAGRALVRTTGLENVAGAWNAWSTTAMPAIAVCNTDLDVAVGAVPTGYYAYKLVTPDGQTWSLDPANPAFAYDDFAGNPDGENSVLNTYDSGRGKVIHLPQQCSTTLNNCRNITAYLPAGYDAPTNATTTYPVMFLHDGQNVWSDHDCCFGHTGWEVDGALDSEIAAGKVHPVVAIAADNTANRMPEYGYAGDGNGDQSVMLSFIDFQVHELQPAALAHVRWDNQKVSIVGSSLGGLVSLELAFRHPETYSGAGSLSGSTWVGKGTHTSISDDAAKMGKQALALYLDSGGDPAQDTDSAQDTIDLRTELVGMGWQYATSPACAAPTGNAICYYREPNATHDELAWKARVWRTLEFLYPAH